MFKLFKKDYSKYKERGDRLFQEGRYAEARHEYDEAFALLKSDTSPEVRDYLSGQIRTAGNHLATMNLQEAVHSFRSGNVAKAIEHAELALEQAEDETIRGNAEDFIQKLELPAPTPEPHSQGHSCNSCSGSHAATAATSDSTTDFLPLMERFELLVQTLPGDLPDRYRQMGERFAYAYMAVHDERLEEGYTILTELSREQKSDILEYEIAIIDFQSHRQADCEKRLNAALSIHPGNSLCHLAMVQLLLDTGRLPKAADNLKQMIRSGMMADQALVMLGDVLVMMGETDAALGKYVEALDLPSVAKIAAQKAVPLLEGMGRTADSQALAKRYLKGCC